jgi:hypothetical protein
MNVWRVFLFGALAILIDGAVARAQPPVQRGGMAGGPQFGNLLIRKDFSDGQLGMVIHNATSGADAAVVDVDRQKAVLVRVPASSTNRVQLQFFADAFSVPTRRGPFYLVTLEHKDAVPNGLTLGAEVFPYWTENELKAGKAELVKSHQDAPDGEGWRTSRYLFRFANDEWDGYRLQLRLLFYRDNSPENVVSQGLVRNISVIQMNEQEVAAATREANPPARQKKPAKAQKP